MSRSGVTKELALKRIALGLVALCAFALTTVGCASKSAPVGTVTEVPAQSFTRAWSLDVIQGKGKIEWIHQAGDYLVALTDSRLVYVIKKDTGKLVTIHEIAGVGPVLPPFTNGKLIAYPVSTEIEVFEINTSKRTRIIELGQAAQSTGTISADTIYIGVSGENGGRLRAVDPARIFDTPKWELMAFGTISSAPLFFQDVIYFATSAGRVYAIDEKREPKWKFDGGFFSAGPILADMAVDASALYVASTDTKLIALDRATGKVKWQYYAGEPIYTSVTPTTQNLYITVTNQGLICLDKNDGDFNRKALWVNHQALSLLSEDTKYTYVRLKNNALAAIDRSTGAITFRSGPTNIEHFVTNAAADGLIYASTTDGKVYAIRPVTRPGAVGEVMFTPTK